MSELTSSLQNDSDNSFENEPPKTSLTSPFNPPSQNSQSPENSTEHESTGSSSPSSTSYSTNSTTYIAADHPGLHTTASNNHIKVICRFRPEDEIEKSKGKNITSFPDANTVVIDGKDGQNTFTFDRVFQDNSSQIDIYKYSVNKTVDDLFNGYNGTVLAYGQTGSGKSYTMIGAPSEEGVIPRISDDIFSRIQSGSTEIEYTVGVSFMELHLESIKDLIDVGNNNDQKFSIHSDKINGMYVRGLSQAFVSSSHELNSILKEGSKARTVVSTNMNGESSRSHAIFQIKLTQKHISSGIMKRSHLFLVDLAGSEKVDKTGASGQTLEEAKKINSSLSTLGNVINSLTDGKSTHIPYRDSKLTRILQEALGGNSRTSLIINCSPSSFNETETLSTLRFGVRAKTIKNTASINTELSASTLRQKLAQLEKINENNQLYIKQLELELGQWRSGDRKSVFSSSQTNTTSPRQSPRASSISSIPGAVGSSIPTNIRNTMISPRTPTKDFASKLPVPSSASATPSTRIPSGGIQASSSPLINSKASFQLSEEIERRDKKIAELENIVLGVKMNNLRNSLAEESKLFTLENSLYKLNNKLNDVESINVNLRKHLLITEKIIESRDLKINKLKSSLKEQQLLVSRETLGFRHKLGDIQSKLEMLNKEKQEEIYSQARQSIMRESMYSVDSTKARDSMFYLDNKTKETFIDMDQKSFLEEQKNARRDASLSLRQNEGKNSEDKSIDSISSEEEQPAKNTKSSILPKDATVAHEVLPSPLSINTPELQKVSSNETKPLAAPAVTSPDLSLSRQLSHYKRGTNDENKMFKKPASKGRFEDNHRMSRLKVPVAKSSDDDSDLPECDLDDVQLDDDEDSPTNSHPDEKQSLDETLASAESKVNLKRISLVDSSKLFRDSFAESNDRTMHSSIAEQDSSILNFHQEYLSIGEFLQESKTRSLDSIRHSLAELGDVDTSETSGMFDSPPNSPKAGLNLRIVKPLRGGGNIMQRINLFQ